MKNNPTVIVSYARTPIGNLLGGLKDLSSPQLAAYTIKNCLSKIGLAPQQINEVILGCVLPAGVGQAPARQAALAAGLPETTPCSTLNKVCGSGMKATMLGDDLLQCQTVDTIVVGGMESMTNAPFLLKKARQGYRLGKGELFDHMMLDGLEDAFTGQPMGFYAEACAKQFGFSRQTQDDYAFKSFERAKQANDKGWFADEMIAVEINHKQETTVIDKDEHPFSVNPEKIPKLNPAFVKDGTVTAGNSSSIADGAASLILMRLATAEQLGLTPLARIIGKASAARTPSEFTIAPIDALSTLMQRIGWQVNDVDLFEINEAFAVVVLAAMQKLAIPLEKLNIHGGAIALGHPIGASGARIIVTLLAALIQHNLKRGIASLCIGGGEATAIAIERY